MAEEKESAEERELVEGEPILLHEGQTMRLMGYVCIPHHIDLARRKPGAFQGGYDLGIHLCSPAYRQRCELFHNDYAERGCVPVTVDITVGTSEESRETPRN